MPSLYFERFQSQVCLLSRYGIDLGPFIHYSRIIWGIFATIKDQGEETITDSEKGISGNGALEAGIPEDPRCSAPFAVTAAARVKCLSVRRETDRCSATDVSKSPVAATKVSSQGLSPVSSRRAETLNRRTTSSRSSTSNLIRSIKCLSV